MATIRTGQALRQQPEALEKGVIATVCRISLSVSVSAGDIHHVGWLPQSAIPLDAIFYRGAAFAAEGVVKFGYSASQEAFFASATFSAAAAPRTARPQGSRIQVSISDDAMPRREPITAVFGAGISVGYVGDLLVFYRMPGQAINQ